MKNRKDIKVIVVMLMVAAVGCFWAASGLEAAEIMLSNGDRVSGKLLKLKEDKLTVEAPYNENMELAWGEIKSLRVDTVTEFLLDDGSRIKGTLRTKADGTIEIVTASAGVVTVASLSKFESINPPPAVTYKGNIDGNTTLKSGNTETIGAHADGKFVARSKRQRFTLTAGWNYAEDRPSEAVAPGSGEQGGISARDAIGTVKYDFFPADKLFLYVNSSFEGDKFQDIRLRTTVGGGMGYQFYEDDRKDVFLEAGVSYFNQDYIVAEDRSYPSGRWAAHGEYKVIPNKILLFHSHEGYVGLENAEEFLLRTEQGIRLTIIENFYANFQTNLTYDNDPAPGKEDTDITILAGLGYSFDM